MSAHENGDSTDGIGVNTDVPSDTARNDSPATTSIATPPGARTRHAPDLLMFEPIPQAHLVKIYKGCIHCRTQKIKCNGQEPCSRCRAFSLKCEYKPLPNQPPPRLPPGIGSPMYTLTTTVDTSGIPTQTLLSTTPVPLFPSSQSRTTVVDRRIRAVSSPRRSESDFGEQSPSLRTPSPSPSTSSSSYSVVTLAHAKSQSGPPNSIFHAIIEAVDKNALVYSQLPGPNEPAPSSDVIRPLVRHYLRYVHPFHRIIDEHDPQFWTRMDQPMAPEVATIVYAMCTLGAIFASKDSTSGTLDKMVHDFHKRTLAVKCERPEDIVTIQTLLILQEFYVVTNQMDLGTKTFQNMLDIADAIKLKDMVKRISTQDKLSPGDAIIRNIWRMIVWTETFANIVSMRTARIEPEKDLTGPALDFRKEEAPIARSPALDAAIFYLGNLFKIFQEISKIRLPISNHDIHPVMSVLEAFTAWHGSLPKNLRCTQNRGYSSGGVSPLASYLDLYYKLGHIFVLNNLPVLWRNKAASLGGRRESALRTLATSANGITATVGDLVKEHDLRNHCLIPAIRCLTEAATIQLANAQVQDPSLSTPAKVNFMKTLWCIKQFNFSLPADVLSSILAPYDDALKNASSNTSSMTSSTQGQDTAPGDDSTQDGLHTRTPSTSTTTDSPCDKPSDGGISTVSGREEPHQPAKEVEKDPSQDNNAAPTLAMAVDSSSVPKRKPSPEPSARGPPKGKRSRTRSPSVSADSHPLRERMRRGSEALPESREEYEHPHEVHPSHSQGPRAIGADTNYPSHERPPSSARHSEQEPWHGQHHVYTNVQGRPPADPRLTSRGNLDEMTRHRPSSPRHEGRYSLPAQQWEDPEYLRSLPVEDDRSPQYSSYPGSFSSRPGAYMGMDQERMYHRRFHRPEQYEHSSRPHPAHPSTSLPRHSRHVHEYPSEADLQSRPFPGYPRPGYPPAASHTTAYDMYDERQRQRHERRISDAIHSDDLRDARSQTHRAVDVRSRKEPLPSSSSPSGMPPSPLVATGGRNRSFSGPVEASRRPEGVMEDVGARVAGSYNIQSGTARASPIPESGERDDGIGYNKDLLHQGSAEAARTREQRQLMREDYGHHESYPPRGGSPTESMREYRGQTQYQQLPRNTMARSPYVEHYTTLYPSHPSHPSHSSSSDYHSIPPHHPRSSGPSSYSSYEHYSSQPHQPAMSYQYRYSRRQHEPRTSYPSTTTSSLHQSPDNMSNPRSASSQQHRYPDHHDDQRSHYEHHPGHADVNARQSQQEQDRSLDRTRAGSSLPSGPRETAVAAGTENGKDRDDEDPGRVSDQLRDPVHRKS